MWEGLRLIPGGAALETGPMELTLKRIDHEEKMDDERLGRSGGTLDGGLHVSRW
jgi:hypothetical protein